MLIEWSDELSVGIVGIDEQHKKLINMMNELDQAILDDSVDEVLRAIFIGLEIYIQRHFSFEEDLFASYDLDDRIFHQQQHHSLAGQLAELKQKFEQNHSGLVSFELMQFLKSWLTHHILHSDKAAARQLIAKGVK